MFPPEVRAGSEDQEPGRRSVTEPPVDGIRIEDDGDRVVVDVRDGRWVGSAAEAERLLTGLHYAIARARPGTTIVSMFVNGKLWGGKTIETETSRAVDDASRILDQLSAQIQKIAGQSDRPAEHE